MKRRNDWASRLSRAVSRRRHMPFEWGTRDCLTFAADCVKAMTNDDPLGVHRGTYSTAAEAAARMQALEFDTLEDVIDDALGANRRIPSGQAPRGSVVTIMRDGEVACGVSLGHLVAVPAIPRGLVYLPAGDAISAWRI